MDRHREGDNRRDRDKEDRENRVMMRTNATTRDETTRRELRLQQIISLLSDRVSWHVLE